MADQEHHTDQVKNPHEHRRHIQELPTTTTELYSRAESSAPEQFFFFFSHTLVKTSLVIQSSGCVVYSK